MDDDDYKAVPSNQTETLQLIPLKGIKRVRKLELLHAAMCLERAAMLINDEYTPDILRCLENVNDTVKLVRSRKSD